MLIVRIELWPGGREQDKKPIASMAIWNLSNLNDISDYDVATHELGTPDLTIKEHKHRFLVKQHKRQQTVFALVAKAALRAARLSKGK